MVKKLNYTLCDTTEEFKYVWYVEDCQDRGIEPESEDSYAFAEWQNEERQREFDCMIENLKYSSESKVPVLITGSLGLWNGTHEIYPRRCESVADAIIKCYGNNDDIKVKATDGYLEVYCYHHDGTNRLEIHKLSKKGAETSKSWYKGVAPTTDTKGYWLAKWHDYLY